MKLNKWICAGLGSLSLLLPSCSNSSKKSEVVYHKVQMKTRTEKLYALDPMDAKGAKLTLSSEAMALVPQGWMKVFQKKKVDPIGSTLQQINEKSKDRFLEIVRTLQAPGDNPTLHKNPAFRTYIQQFAKMGGKNDLAVMVVRGSASDFASGGMMEIFLGHFDVHQLDWKWVVRSDISSGKLSWDEAMLIALEKGFELAEEAESAEKSLLPQ